MYDYYGIFNNLSIYYKDLIKHEEFYEGFFSRYYDSFGYSLEELDFYINVINMHGPKVLEICCGNGRLTIPLARNGYYIDGVDISVNMIQLLEKRLFKQSKRVQRRVNTYISDVFQFSNNTKYNVIIIPATSITLLGDDSNKLSLLFNHLCNLLEEDGCIAFDIRGELLENEKVDILRLIPFEYKGERALVYQQEFIGYKSGKITSNYYAEVQKQEGKIERYMSITERDIVSFEKIQASISKCNLYISDKVTQELEDMNVIYLVCKRRDDYG